MILTYDEGLKRAQNPDWFKNFYKKEDIASDDEVKEINELVKKVGALKLNEYLETDEDIILQKEYVLDLLDYLKSL